MDPKYKYYLDDILLADEPEGWQNLVEEIVRDLTLHGILVNMKVTLRFSGDGFAYIKNIFDCSSFCSEIKVRIMEQCSEGDSYTQLFDGYIKMGDVTFYEDLCVCETAVVDNSFYARIKNNAVIEAAPHMGKSKNGLIIAAASHNVCKMFDPTNCTYEVGNSRYAYRILEILKFLVAFMSDGDVDFKSDFFDIGGPQEGLFLTNGAHLKNALSVDYQNLDIGKLSFQKLFEELFKVFNLGFIIEQNTKPTLRIEPASFFYGSAVTDTLKSVRQVKKKIKTDQLYASVNFGSAKTIFKSDVPVISFPDEVDFLGWKDETFHLVGQCNIDTVLNLKGDYIRSSNIIEDVLLGVTASPNTAYDQDFIFVSAEPDGAGQYQAIKYDILGQGTPPCQYNGNITNYESSLNFLGTIPNTIREYLFNGNHSFQATGADCQDSGGMQTADSDYGPVAFADDYTDPNFNEGDYSPAGNVYTASQNGIYNFYSSVPIAIVAYPLLQITGLIKIFNAADVFQREFPFDTQQVGYIDGSGNYIGTYPNGQLFTLQGTSLVQMNATERAKVYIRFQRLTTFADYAWMIVGGSCALNSIGGNLPHLFRCTANGVERTYDTTDAKVIEWQFQYQLENSRWKNIKLNPKDILAFNIDGSTNEMPWIEDIKYNKKTSMAQISLIGKQIQKCK